MNNFIHNIIIKHDIVDSYLFSNFRKHGLSSWSTELGPRSLLDDERMANTRFLFFYLNSSSRALETLILVSQILLSQILFQKIIFDFLVVSGGLLRWPM